jgi:pseudouridine-5'-phosphate glycosidase
VTEAVERVRRAGVTGQAVTPAVLAAVEELSAGRSVEVNRRLIADNAELAARVAVAYADQAPQSTMAATGPPPSGP